VDQDGLMCLQAATTNTGQVTTLKPVWFNQIITWSFGKSKQLKQLLQD
jgi:hypothetical protein